MRRNILRACQWNDWWDYWDVYVGVVYSLGVCMGYRICKEQPKEWDGEHYFTCEHSLNSRSKIYFLMHCNILKKMPDGRLKIKVFGYRWSHPNGEKIRYVDDFRVVKASEYT